MLLVREAFPKRLNHILWSRHCFLFYFVLIETYNWWGACFLMIHNEQGSRLYSFVFITIIDYIQSQFLLQIEKKSKIEKRYCGENLQKSRMEPTVSKTKSGTIWSNHQQLLSPTQSTWSDSVDEIFWSNLLAKDAKLTQIPNVMWNVHSGFLAQNQYYPFTKWPRYA